MTDRHPPLPLTERQRDLLRIVVEWIETHGVAPTNRELQVEMDSRSTSGVHTLLHHLHEKGWIRVLGTRRGITVLHRPPMPPFDQVFVLSPSLAAANPGEANAPR